MSVLQTCRYQGKRSLFDPPIPHCANSVLYVDYTGMPKLGGYDFALMIAFGLTRFTRLFP